MAEDITFGFVNTMIKYHFPLNVDFLNFFPNSQRFKERRDVN